VLSADANRILVVINMVGAAIIEASKDGKIFRVQNHPQPELFAGRRAGGAWPRREGFLVHLYRDPFFVSSSPSRGSSPLLAVDWEGNAAILPPPTVSGGGFELFALLPSPAGPGEKDRWYATLRKDGRDRVTTRYLEVTSLGGSDFAGRDLRRVQFEAALAPQSLSADGIGREGQDPDQAVNTEKAAVRRACASLIDLDPVAGAGVKDFMVRLRGPRGSDTWYISGSMPGSTSSSGSDGELAVLSAWLLPDGRVVALDESGRAAVAGIQGVVQFFEFKAPIAGAKFTNVAAASGIVVAAWEEGDFTEIRSAGVVVESLR
jgi:hypothetical protein